MNGKGRPEKLTDELKRWIFTMQKGRKKKLKAPELRKGLRIVIEDQRREELAKQGIKVDKAAFNEDIESRLPGISSIQKYLSEQDPDKVSKLDKPWHLGTLELEDNPLPPLPAEAIRHTLLLQGWAKTNNEQPLTIRHVLWASRLY